MAQFASDAFGGTEGTELSAYSGSWAKVAALSGAIEIVSGRIRASSTTSAAYYHSGSPATADYSVSADFYATSSSDSGNNIFVLGRADTTANTHYRFGGLYYHTGPYVTLALHKFVAGTVTQLGSSVNVSYTAGANSQVKLEMVSDAIKGYWDGGGSASISVIDSAITSAGKAGVRTYTGATPTDSNTAHLDNFSADDIGGGGATITPTGLSSSAFGSFSVNAGDRILTFTGKASDEAFGAFNLRARNLVSFTGKASDGAFGSFNVYPGKVIILPNSKTTDSVFGTHSLLSGQKIISPSAKTSDEAFGSFIIVSGDRILLMNGVASNEVFGTFNVNNNTANQTILTSGYFDSAFGSFSLRPDQYIIFEGKEYLEFGQFLLSGSAVVRAMHFFDWVSQQPGLRGSLNDKLYQYLIAQGFTGSTPTMMFLWLRSLGYAGNTATMLTAFERDYTTRWH